MKTFVLEKTWAKKKTSHGMGKVFINLHMKKGLQPKIKNIYKSTIKRNKPIKNLQNILIGNSPMRHASV